MTALRLKLLPDGCSSDEFGKRVNDAMINHIPFLRRPFPVADGSLGEWVIGQMPEALGADGRRLKSNLSVAQMSDGNAVASLCIAIVAAGQAPSIKDGPLGDFILIQEETGTESGRRPRGLDDRRGGGRAGDRRTARSGKGGGRGGGQGDERPKGCSTPAPRGPTCKFNHPPPCFRDCDWPGPISQAIIDNKPRYAKLLGDRDVEAARLFKAGLRSTSKAVALKGPSGKEETIAVLDDIEESQFDECDDCNDDTLLQAQELNDILEIQDGQFDIPGVHMPSRLQQLRGNAVISGLARDEQVFQSEARAWRLRVDAGKRSGQHRSGHRHAGCH